jgi:hypothetical protein
MRTETIKGRKVRFYDSIENLPIDNYTEFNRFVVLDAGVGSDIDAIVKHNQTAINYMDAGKIDLAKQILRNQNEAYYFILSNQNLEFLSFRQLIHSIDGEDPTENLIEDLKGIVTKGFVSKIVSWFKKKVPTK